MYRSQGLNWQIVLAWCCSLACACALLSLPPVSHPDTSTYLAHSALRGPLYPYLLDAFRAAFGEEGFLAWVARAQALGIIAASAFFAVRLGRCLGLGSAWRHGMFLILTLPGLKFASAILTEPFGYTLLILFWTLFVEEVVRPGSRRIWPLPVLCGVCLLLRPQLVYLPVFLGLFFLVRLVARRDRSSLAGVALLAVCLAGATVVRGLDNTQRHGGFSTASTGGVHLLASLVYIAAPEDAQTFASPLSREVFRTALSQAQAAKLTREHWGMSRAHFDEIMPELVPLVQGVVAGALPREQSVALGEANTERLASSLGIELVAHMPLRYLAFLFRKFYDGQPFYYALLAISAGLALGVYVRTGARPALVYALACVHSFLSYGVNLLVGVYSLRYLLPADALVLALAVATGGALLAGVRQTGWSRAAGAVPPA